MSRDRSRSTALAFLFVASLLLSGCGLFIDHHRVTSYSVEHHSDVHSLSQVSLVFVQGNVIVHSIDGRWHCSGSTKDTIWGMAVSETRSVIELLPGPHSLGLSYFYEDVNCTRCGDIIDVFVDAMPGHVYQTIPEVQIRPFRRSTWTCRIEDVTGDPEGQRWIARLKTTPRRRAVEGATTLPGLVLPPLDGGAITASGVSGFRQPDASH